MFQPLDVLLRRTLGLDVTAREFTAQYGIADIVGGAVCGETVRGRLLSRQREPLDDRYAAEILLLLPLGRPVSLEDLDAEISFSTSLLMRRALPALVKQGIVAREGRTHVRRLVQVPSVVRRIVAVEAKQVRWQEAILQARRYTFFAEQTYVAVWKETVPRVDISLLTQHRLGLIGVALDRADIVVPAPLSPPLRPRMRNFCSEFLYRHYLEMQQTPASVATTDA